MGYLILILLSLLAMVVLRFSKERAIMRIEFEKVAAFIAFMVMWTIFRVLKLDFLIDIGVINTIHIPTDTMPKWTIGLVFWEDMFFAVPIYFMMKYMKRKWLRNFFIVALSIMFGLGHEYEGPQAMLLLSFCPFFVTYHFGKKYGFGTTMCCHIIYDFFTAMLPLFLPLFLQ